MQVDSFDFERIRHAVATGGAVCLVGAGFSTDATDQQGKSVPSSQALIDEIKSRLDIDPSETASLSDIADYCEEMPERQRELQQILLSRLTLCNPSAAQLSIVNQPWRSIFTTNFDDTIERCLSDVNCQSITPTSESINRVPGKMPVYYLHGRARDILDSAKDPRIVISERNYLNLHEDRRELYAQLKNELFAASMVVIVGYSVRDLDVARIVLEAGHAFKNKTIIICDSSERNLAVSRLTKFGEVLAVGIDRLASELGDTSLKSTESYAPFQFLEEVQSVAPSEDIESDDFIKLILTGKLVPAKYFAQIQTAGHVLTPYCIRRKGALDTILNRQAGSVNRFVVASDFGNGKSIFLDQLAAELTVRAFKVFRISSRATEVFSEIDRLVGSREQTAFLIDDVIRYRNVAKYIAPRLGSVNILVCSMRGDSGEAAFREFSNDLGGAVREVDLNRLSASEISDWDSALERWGLWEQRISLSKDERISFLTNDCACENRSIILSLFRSSQIAIKIDQIVEFFLRQGRHQRAFAALLISSLCQQHVSWESMVSWLDIDEQRLRHDIDKSDLSELFMDGREWNVLTSAQLAEHILRTKYVTSDKDNLLDVFSLIVLGTAESATDTYLGEVFRENLKELMKFRFLTRLFGDDDSAVIIISRVYKRLSEARLIRSNPQFWLQYAMSRMEVNDLGNAEVYLNTALGLAKGRGKEYSPFQILDQRARLYFRKNSIIEGEFRLSEIRAAIVDLGELLKRRDREVIYLFRSVPLVLEFLETQIDMCSVELRGELLALLEGISEAGKGYSKFPRSQKGETRVLQKAMTDAQRILKFA